MLNRSYSNIALSIHCQLTIFSSKAKLQIPLIVAKVTSDGNGEANPDFDNSGAPETFFVRNKKKFEK